MLALLLAPMQLPAAETTSVADVSKDCAAAAYGTHGGLPVAPSDREVRALWGQAPVDDRSEDLLKTVAHRCGSLICRLCVAVLLHC